MDNKAYTTSPEGGEYPKSANLTRETLEEEESNDVIVKDCATIFVNLPFLNALRSPKWFLVFLSLAACVQGVLINGLVNVVITSIEIRFGMKSSDTGLLVACQDIGSLLVMLPASHFGSRLGASKPRWIAVGMMVLGLGSFVWTLPHFLTGPYEPGDLGGDLEDQDRSSLCRLQREDLCQGEEEEVEEGESLSKHKFVFIVGQLLNGAGCSPLLSLGTTFMDEAVGAKSSPVYIAIFQMWLVIGPALGYVIGGQLLLIHTDLVQDTNISPASPLWVGAWWPGFFITGSVCFVAAVAIHLYPASINRTRDTTVRKADAGPEPTFFTSLRSLLTNPTFMLLALASGGDAAIINGYAAFLPKFMEQQYGLTNGLAAQIVGMIVVPAGGLGTFLGGWVVKRFKLTRNQIILLFISISTGTLPLLPAFLMSCPGPSYAGISTSATITTVKSDCRAACDCPSLSYDPVCGTNSVMYLSPCHGGCTTSPGPGNFTDCQCIDGGGALRENCATECDFLVPFMVINFLVVFVTFLLLIPMVVACLRSVRDSEHSLAIGLQVCIARVIGSIPGPIAFGFFLDKTCVLWDQDCGGDTACLAYDNWQMGVKMISTSLIFRLPAVLLFCLSYWSSRKLNIGQDGTQ